jgi:hypothetical protein
MRRRRREATANDSDLPKLHRREDYFATAHKADNILSIPLYIFRGVLFLLRRRCDAIGLGDL